MRFTFQYIRDEDEDESEQEVEAFWKISMFYKIYKSESIAISTGN